MFNIVTSQGNTDHNTVNYRHILIRVIKMEKTGNTMSGNLNFLIFLVEP